MQCSACYLFTFEFLNHLRIRSYQIDGIRDQGSMRFLQSILTALLKWGYVRISFSSLNLINFPPFYQVLLLEDMEFMSRPSDEGKAQHSCGFRTRSFRSSLPLACGRHDPASCCWPQSGNRYRVRQWPSWSRAWKAWHRDSRGMQRKPERVLSEDEQVPKSELPRICSVTQSCK